MTDELLGIWTRRSLTVAGQPVDDHQQCYWAQGHHLFADVRVAAVDPASNTAFAGFTEVEADRITWHHDFDLGPTLPGMADAGDSARFIVDGDRLVEHGTITLDGESFAYEEEWHRMTDRGVPVITWTITRDGHRHAIAIEAGPWLVLATASDGGPRRGGGWVLARSAADSAPEWHVLVATSPELIGLPGDSDAEGWSRTPDT